jgi:hypothetical protein
MTGFEYLPRPYPYDREPFLVASGEKVGFEGKYFSVPAFAAQVDKRLFTVSASHPVANVFKLYVNRGTNTTISIEPTISASGYERGTPHYENVILDIRNVLQSAWNGHASDSDHSAHDFRICHLDRVHEPYDLANSSRPDVIPGDYVHKESVTLTPSGNELGARGFQDIDIDEVQWQPFSRPKKIATLNGMPFEPCFPMAIDTNGGIPEMSSLDEERFGQLGLGGSASGGLVVTGDVLLQGTSVKLLSGSGAPITNEGQFNQIVPWALYPAQNKLNLYYTTENSGTITALGRQAIYDTPTPDGEGVYLLNTADVGESGCLVQNWPGNYHATSGIDRNGKAHNGVHAVDKLIYNLYEGNAGNLIVGRSVINGKKVFGHFVGTEANSKGVVWAGALKHCDGDTVYGWGGVINPNLGGFAQSSVSWFTTGKTFSPIGWTLRNTSVWQPRAGFFGSPPSTTWTLGDIQATTSRIITYKAYAQWGYMDRVITPDDNFASLGVKKQETITYETHTYQEGTDPATGGFAWVELPPPQSPVFSTQTVTFYENTFQCNNFISFFFLRKLNHGMVNVNGQIGYQWSEPGPFGVPPKPTHNQFSFFGDTSTTLTPPTAYSQSTTVIGFFPSWRILLSVTTNNQVSVPNQIQINGNFSAISFAPDIPITTSVVDKFGPAVWDPEEGVNYLYFSTIHSPTRFYFAKMNTSFVITHINQVDSTDAIMSGRSAVISI